MRTRSLLPAVPVLGLASAPTWAESRANLGVTGGIGIDASDNDKLPIDDSPSLRVALGTALATSVEARAAVRSFRSQGEYDGHLDAVLGVRVLRPVADRVDLVAELGAGIAMASRRYADVWDVSALVEARVGARVGLSSSLALVAGAGLGLEDLVGDTNGTLFVTLDAGIEIAF